MEIIEYTEVYSVNFCRFFYKPKDLTPATKIKACTWVVNKGKSFRYEGHLWIIAELKWAVVKKVAWRRYQLFTNQEITCWFHGLIWSLFRTLPAYKEYFLITDIHLFHRLQVNSHFSKCFIQTASVHESLFLC